MINKQTIFSENNTEGEQKLQSLKQAKGEKTIILNK